MSNSSSDDLADKDNHVLASRNFRLLWLGQAVSTFGDKFSEIAIPILVYNLTGSAMQLGLAFLAQTSAALIFGLFAGVFSDRWNRQRTMIVTDVLRAFLMFAIIAVPFLPVALSGQLVTLYALGFAATAVKQFFLPAKVATIPETVTESQLVSANSIDQATMTLMGFFGFAIAGLLIGLVGEQAAFVIDGVTFLISAVFIWLMRLPISTKESAKRGVRSVFEDIWAGLLLVWQVPLLKGTVVVSMLAPLALGATQVLLLIFSRDVLHAGAFGFGLLEGTFGLGITFGAFILARYAKGVKRGKLLALGVIGMGIGQMLAVISPSLLLRAGVAETAVLMAASLPFFFLGAACNAAIFIGIRTIVQENSPENMIGRVFSVITVVSSAAIALGASMAGLADIGGAGLMIFIWGVVLAIVGAAALSWTQFREA
jgi:MFS family permease